MLQTFTCGELFRGPRAGFLGWTVRKEQIVPTLDWEDPAASVNVKPKYRKLNINMQVRWTAQHSMVVQLWCILPACLHVRPWQQATPSIPRLPQCSWRGSDDSVSVPVAYREPPPAGNDPEMQQTHGMFYVDKLIDELKARLGVQIGCKVCV